VPGSAGPGLSEPDKVDKSEELSPDESLVGGVSAVGVGLIEYIKS
jgi:hypothetical protein